MATKQYTVDLKARDVNDMSIKKYILHISSSIYFILVAVVIVLLIFTSLISYGNKFEEHTYSASPLSENIYAWYHQVYSSTPAQNYDVITLCCDGTVMTFQGNVTIIYTKQKPYVTVRSYNMVHGDEVCVYVPEGGVLFQEDVGV